MSKELLLIDTTQTGQTDRYALLFSDGKIVRAGDGVLLDFNATNYPACAIALSDTGNAGYYFGDVPPNTPTRTYRRLYYRRVGGTAALGDPPYAEQDPPLSWLGTSGLPLGATAQATYTEIFVTWRENGVLTDVTSVWLRDANPGGTWGVKRLDTDATVLPPTQFERLSAGTYRVRFADPAPGLVYRYYEEITEADGTVHRNEKQRSGTGAPLSRSYLLSGDADAAAILLPSNMLPAWLSPATTADAKARALEQATADVDAAGPYQGRRYDTTGAQVLEFPRVPYESPGPYGRQLVYGATGRTGVADQVWDWDDATKTAVVPLNVKRAVVYQADAILAGVRGPALDAQQLGIASQSVGSMSKSYRDLRQGGGLPVLCRPAEQLMRKYLLKTGGLR
jgi:hypothetical protein